MRITGAFEWRDMCYERRYKERLECLTFEMYIQHSRVRFMDSTINIIEASIK